MITSAISHVCTLCGLEELLEVIAKDRLRVW